MTMHDFLSLADLEREAILDLLDLADELPRGRVDDGDRGCGVEIEHQQEALVVGARGPLAGTAARAAAIRLPVSLL